MKVALTGTPGTGKTSVARILERQYRVIYLNDFEDARVEYDEQRDSYVVDIDYLTEQVSKISGDFVVEGHYAHNMPVDIAVVLRCHPDELKKRLEARGYSDRKVRENMEAEAMGLITDEAIAELGASNVYELDTTNAAPEDISRKVEQIIAGAGEEYRKRINYMGEILKWY